jgi:alpha-L-rhamnosidase
MWYNARQVAGPSEARNPRMVGKRCVTGFVLLLVIWLVTGAGRSDAAPASQSAGLKVTTLTTEYARNPLGIDVPRPRLSWLLSSSTRAQVQTAYQILVSSSVGKLGDNVGDLWDSGKVTSAQSIDVPYAGRPLTSRTRYTWKVRVWDRRGAAAGWSAPAWWETALMQSSDWRAQWIGQPAFDSRPDLEDAHWIWYPDGDPTQEVPTGLRYFRLPFDLPADRQVAQATLTTTADNEFTAYLGGGQVATSNDWTRVVRTDVSTRLAAGRNVLALSANNIDGPGALIARLRIDFTSGAPLVVDTGATTRSTNSEQAGWQAPTFDDAGWVNATQAVVYGSPPWNRLATVPREPLAAAPLLRKEFTVRKPIARARVYVVGLGNYVLTINGKRVGDRVLDPAYTEYENHVQYATYDVGSQLQRGGNAFGVALAPGFYYYNAPKLLLQAHIDYTDGSREVVVTDQSWRLTPGPTSFQTDRDNAVFAGETHDARREPGGWDRPGFDAVGWQVPEVVPAPGGALVAQAIEPVTVAETVAAAGVSQPRPGSYVVDMRRTVTGWIQLRATGQAGSKVSIQYGEKLNGDGTVDGAANPPRPRWQRDEYVFAGHGVETWEPSFTFKSFRYVQFDGLGAAPTTGNAGTVLGRVVHSAVHSTGEFSSSQPLYNQIHQATRRTIGDILLGFPAIDPGNEKNGWAGDTQLLTPAMIDNYDMASFLTKWLTDVRDGQRADGSISMIDPIRDGCCYAWAPEWTAAYPVVAWELYLRYGDRQVLESHYDGLTKYLQWQTGSMDNGIAPAGVWGDWAAPGYTYAPEDHRLTATAYIYRQVLIMADIAGVLGHGDAATRYRETAAHIRDRFNETFLNAGDGRYETATDPGYRQASNALPVAFGIVPDEYRTAVVDGLVADIRTHGGHLDTGILGTPALLQALTENGHADVAYGIVSQTTYPSWGEWLKAGADTLWEEWGLAGRSRNHPMHGTVDEWFFRYVAGIAPDPAHPGYQNTLIQPRLATPVNQARASHDSPYGTVSVAWKLANGGLVLDVDIPANATATVWVPAADASKVREDGCPAGSAPGVHFSRFADGYAEYQVGSGRYQFISRAVRVS